MLTPGQKGLLAAAALIFTLIWFAQLGGRALYDPDEGRYAEIPREMLSGGDWVIPHLDGLAYLEKPPLQYWLTALAYEAFGQSEGSARLFTGVCGYLSLVLVFFTGSRLWGFAAGLRAAMLTAASTLFVLLGHQLTLDMALNFFLLACLACFVEAQLRRDSPRAQRAWMLGCWCAAALAVLTKGLIGVLIPATTLAVYTIWQRDSRALRLNAGWGSALFAAIALPWFILAAHANAEFLKFFFVREHFQRFLTPIEHRSEPWWFFIAVLAGGILPWLPQALGALGRGWRASAPRGRFDAGRLLWIWSVFVLVFFSFSDSKLIPYILPAVPTLALLCAGAGALRCRPLAAGVLLSAAAGAGALAYAGGAWSSGGGHALWVQLEPVLPWTGVLLAAAAIGAATLLRRGHAPAALAVQCTGWFLAAATILVGAQRAEALYSSRELGLALEAAAPASAALFSVQCYGQSLPYYAGRTLLLVDYRDEFDLGLRQDPAQGIATLAEFASRWRALSDGFAVMPMATRDRLAGEGLPMHEVAHSHDRVLVSR